MSKVDVLKVVNVLDNETAQHLYNLLRDEVKWEDGIRTRNGGFTRKGYSVPPSGRLASCIKDLVNNALEKLGFDGYMVVFGTYLNYYENGNSYTPVHTHPGTTQIIISLGAERTLMIGSKKCKLKSGQATYFKGEKHGVPREPFVRGGRISIATFVLPVPNATRGC